MPTLKPAFWNLAGGGGNFFEKKQNKSCCFQNIFNFPVANFPSGQGCAAASATAGQPRCVPYPADERQAGHPQELHPRDRPGYARNFGLEVASAGKQVRGLRQVIPCKPPHKMLY